MATDLVKTQATIKQYLMGKDVLEQMKMALPDIGMTPERMARIAFTSMTLNPKLLECSIQSLIRCVITSAQYGLLPDGRQAHLIPYGKECTFQIDYKGLMAIVRRDSKVQDLFCDVAYENDEFEIVSGSERYIKHIPNIKADRGKPICYYSILKYKDGGLEFEYMTPAEVERVRKTFSKAPNSPAWVNSFEEMAKKTVLHRHLKKADLSPITNYAIQTSTAGESEAGKTQPQVFAETAAFLGQEISGDILDAEVVKDEKETQEQKKTGTDKLKDKLNSKTETVECIDLATNTKLANLMAQCDVEQAKVLEHFGISELNRLPESLANEAIEFIYANKA